MKFRKRPVVIEAKLLEKNAVSITEIYDWLGYSSREGRNCCNYSRDAWDNFIVHISGEDGIIIKTLEGNHLASWGDYIIKGVAGEFYPCKPDIFAKTYEPIEGD